MGSQPHTLVCSELVVYVRYFLSLIGFLFFCVQYLLFTSIYHSYGSHSGRCCRHAVVVFVVAYR